MIDRRTFLRNTTLVALTPSVSAFLQQSVRGAAASSSKKQRILVVVELDGGNDGINTIVPFRDEGYAQHRHELRLSQKSLLPISDELAFHPSLRPLIELLDDGHLAVIQGVGYPKSDRSHFRGRAIWHSGRVETVRELDVGWAGLALDADTKQGSNLTDAAFVGKEQVCSALLGRRSTATAIHPHDRRLELTQPIWDDATLTQLRELQGDDELANIVSTALMTARQVTAATSKAMTKCHYPDSEIATSLKTIAQLIKADFPSRVFYTTQTGYDTHSLQLPTHAQLLGDFSAAVQTFLADLMSSGHDDEVLLMTVSEFGRRVAENGSYGTDHGTAAPMFLVGNGIHPGVHGRTPTLTDLLDGDLKHSIDFRQLYATVLDNWLGLPSFVALGQKFVPLPVIRGA